MRTITTLCITLLVLVLGSCGHNDDGDVVRLHYNAETYPINFYSEGSIPAPEINWPRDPGSFSLVDPVEGLTINAVTGAIGVMPPLAIGEHKITIKATDGKETWETTITLDYGIQSANLTGGQNNNPDSHSLINVNTNLTLNEDGTLEIVKNNDPETTGVGTWAVEDGVLKMHLCTYCADTDPMSVATSDEHTYYEGPVEVYEDEGAVVMGNWYVIRFDPDSTTKMGDFIFTWY